MEKEVIGFLISQNPLAKYKQVIEKKSTKRIGELFIEDVGATHVLVGIISNKKIIKTKKNNDEMAFITMFDETGSIEAVIFPKTYEKLKHLLLINQAIICKGKINDKDGTITILIDQAVKLD
jgi:DNA polymerase-3 subunit alpha